ncbi:MAG: oxidoreductase [Candidatus Taylorbacteria bacterium]|nr:oxidoreductase [Candidatus Taylorbacteria bacterium]
MEHDHTNHDHNHEHPAHHPHHNGKGQNLMIPLSIVIAGAFIALAVFFTNQGPKVQTLESTLEKIAKLSGVNASKFDKCLASGKYGPVIVQDVADAVATGGNGTPWSIVVGPTGIKYPLSGAQPIAKVQAIIDLALAKSPAPTGADTKSLENMKQVTAADHIMGDINAPVKVVLYSDLECPFCKSFHSTMQQLMASSYGTNKQVAWVWRNFPLKQLHPKSPKESEGAECAAELGGNDAFWKFIDKVNEVTPSNNKLDEAQF